MATLVDGFFSQSLRQIALVGSERNGFAPLGDDLLGRRIRWWRFFSGRGGFFFFLLPRFQPLGVPFPSHLRAQVGDGFPQRRAERHQVVNDENEEDQERNDDAGRCDVAQHPVDALGHRLQ